MAVLKSPKNVKNKKQWIYNNSLKLKNKHSNKLVFVSRKSLKKLNSLNKKHVCLDVQTQFHFLYVD